MRRGVVCSRAAQPAEREDLDDVRADQRDGVRAREPRDVAATGHQQQNRRRRDDIGEARARAEPLVDGGNRLRDHPDARQALQRGRRIVEARVGGVAEHRDARRSQENRQDELQGDGARKVEDQADERHFVPLDLRLGRHQRRDGERRARNDDEPEDRRRGVPSGADRAGAAAAARPPAVPGCRRPPSPAGRRRSRRRTARTTSSGSGTPWRPNGGSPDQEGAGGSTWPAATAAIWPQIAVTSSAASGTHTQRSKRLAPTRRPTRDRIQRMPMI